VSQVQPTILIVSDENAQPVAWLSAWLARQAWPVRWHLDVGAALRGVMRDRPRLVIVDVGEPLDLTPRVELIAQVHRRRPETALAAAAARAVPSVERAVRAAGADLYLVDPADLRALDGIVNAVPATVGSSGERSPPEVSVRVRHRRTRGAHRIRGRPPPQPLALPANPLSEPIDIELREPRETEKDTS
jgi:DNA-binding response OmpR family regulator